MRHLFTRFRSLFAASDMTVGTPWKSILRFAVPMIIGNVAQQLYSTVDSIVVGHYIGDNALAAVALGAEEIEFDLWATKDGEIVSCHDETLDWVSNGPHHRTDPFGA